MITGVAQSWRLMRQSDMPLANVATPNFCSVKHRGGTPIFAFNAAQERQRCHLPDTTASRMRLVSGWPCQHYKTLRKMPCVPCRFRPSRRERCKHASSGWARRARHGNAKIAPARSESRQTIFRERASFNAAATGSGHTPPFRADNGLIFRPSHYNSMSNYGYAAPPRHLPTASFPCTQPKYERAHADSTIARR